MFVYLLPISLYKQRWNLLTEFYAIFARYIKMSSPHLNNLIIVGCMLTYLSVIFLGLDSSLSSIGMFLFFIFNSLLSVSILFSFINIFVFSLSCIGSKVTFEVNNSKLIYLFIDISKIIQSVTIGFKIADIKRRIKELSTFDSHAAGTWSRS